MWNAGLIIRCLGAVGFSSFCQRNAIELRAVASSAVRIRLNAFARQVANLPFWLAPQSHCPKGDFLTTHATACKLSQMHRCSLVLATHAPDWVTRGPEIRQAVTDGHHLREIRSKWDRTLQPTAWDRDVDVLKRDLTETGAHWWRFLSGRWREAKKDFSALLLDASRQH